MLLRLPNNNWNQPEVLASWLELSALSRDNGFIVRGAVAESLRDSNLFDKTAESGSQANDNIVEGSAASALDDIWRVLEMRSQILNGAWPFQLTPDRLGRSLGNETLDSNAAYSAMLLIEAASSKWFGDEIKIGHEEKIRIWFEHIAAASIKQLVKGTTVRFGSPFPKGWPSGFPNRVEKMASEFGITHRAAEIDAYASTNQQDDSLDIVSRWRLVDEEPSSPYLLVQCATGANWKAAKVAEPNMDLWRRYISWNGPIYKALAIPFALRGPGELKQISIRHHDTIVFDRIRLAAGRPDQLIEASLRRHLVRWCREKFNLLTNPGKRSTSEETPSEAITKRPPHPRRTKVFRRSKT